MGAALWGAVRAREGGRVVLEGVRRSAWKERDTHKLAPAGETPVDVHGGLG